MANLDPVTLEKWTSGTWKNGAPSAIVAINFDTRKLLRGELFVALRTEARDGHDYLDEAKEAGACGALVDRYREEIDLPQLLVADVSKSLIEAARGYRLSWQAEVVGVTGSCGKTTCKEVLACLLSRRIAISTAGNLNNLIGVPVSILRAEAAEAEFAVLEAGISEPGEMQQLADAIRPDWGIVTAIGAAHLEELKSVETIAFEKGKLLQGSELKGAFVGETVEPLLKALGYSKAIVVRRDPDVSSEWSFDFTSRAGRTNFRQRIGRSIQDFEYAGSGAGLASNVALAIATACTLGLSVDDMRKSLASWAPAQMRNEWRDLGDSRVFLDCYNANPISMRDSLTTFVAETPETAPRFYLLGSMEELGVESPRLHEELGREIPLRKQDFLLVIGSEAKSVLRGMNDAGRDTGNCLEIESIEDARGRLSAFAGSVFLKGSRRYRLESVLEFLEGGVSC